MLEDVIRDGLTGRFAATGVTPEQARARGRLIEWLRDPGTDAVDAVLRLSQSRATAVALGREEGRRATFERYCGPRPKAEPRDTLDSIVTSFLNRVKGKR